MLKKLKQLICRHNKLKVENLGKFYSMKKSNGYTDITLFQLTRCRDCGKYKVEVVSQDNMLNDYQVWKFKRLYLDYKVENIKTSQYKDVVKGLV